MLWLGQWSDGAIGKQAPGTQCFDCTYSQGTAKPMFIRVLTKKAISVGSPAVSMSQFKCRVGLF